MMTAGTRLGPYEIVSPIGAGGMGEVYRARDTRLERSVAIKILPAEFAQDAKLKLRFEREAKAISSLSHPNICTLYDVGHDNGTDYLVMEYLEGETLADRLTKGPLPIAQTLKIAIEIASALDRAHRQGIIHRDLKPGNVMLTKSGAKLLDFGLAKGQPPVAAGLTTAGTEKQLTAEGTIVGTFQYMAPEQLEGNEADARTDLFAFGAVLYEMATGRKAFEGKTKTSLIASIVSGEPAPMSQLQPLAPPAFERVVKSCLAKDPDERWQTAHDVLLELKWIAEAGSQAGVPAPMVARRKHREGLAWILAAAAVVLAAIGWFLAARELRKPVAVVRLSIVAPEKTNFAFDRGPMMISPDGRKMVFAVRTGTELQLFLRSLDAVAAKPLSGTIRAAYPFWSPDSRFIAFFLDGKLKKIDLSGGPAQIVCDAPVGRGGTWNRDGIILFAPFTRGVIHRVSAAGGPSVPLTRLEHPQSTHRWPLFLPDGKHFLFLSQQAAGSSTTGDAVYVASLDAPDAPKFLLNASSNVAYTPPGYLLFYREGTLMAQRFDADELKLLGEPFSVVGQVQFFANAGSATFSVSDNGTLVYQTGPGGGLSQLMWFDTSGNSLGSVGPAADYARPRLSPDGRRVAVDVIDPRSGNTDLWIYDVSRRTASRFTFDPAFDINPTWSPDGERIIFNSNRKGAAELYQKVTSGAGTEEFLFDCQHFCAPFHWSRDGRFVTFQIRDPKTSWDLWIWSVPEKKAYPVLQTEFNETSGSFSPDGRWIAYASDESGQNEIYVQALRNGTGRWQISTQGGSYPVWSPDGSQIFFTSPDDTLMAAPVRMAPVVETGEPKALFTLKLKSVPGRRYDVAPDGKRFLVNTEVGEEGSEPLIVVLNWATELKK